MKSDPFYKGDPQAPFERMLQNCNLTKTRALEVRFEWVGQRDMKRRDQTEQG